MRKQRKKVRLKKLPTDHTRRTEPFFQSQVPYLRASIFSLPYSYSPVNHWDNSDVEQRVKVRLYCICVASLCCSDYSTKLPPLFVLHSLQTDPRFSFFFSLLQVVACRIYETLLIPLGLFRLETCQSLSHLQRRLSYLQEHCYWNVAYIWKPVPDKTLWQNPMPASVLPGKRQRSRGDFIPWNLFYNVCPCPSLK